MTKIFFLLMTFYLSSGQPIQVARQAATYEGGLKPVHSLDACIDVARNQRRRFMESFAASGYEPFMDVRIECKEATKKPKVVRYARKQ